MTLSGRIYANFLVQLLAAAFLALYVYFTYRSHPANLVWLIAALLLGAFGAFRKVNETLLASLGVVALYGCYIIFKLYLSTSGMEAGWNELIWLLLFPFCALIGGLNQNISRHLSNESRQSGPNNPNRGEEDREDPEAFPAIDPGSGFADATTFTGKLEEEVFRGLRSKRTVTLLLVEVQYFKPFREEYGYEQTGLLLHRVTELIRDVMRDADVKGYLGDGLFAVILTGQQQASISIMIDWMEDKFNSLLLSRPRREGTVKARLRYGSSECPGDGMNHQELLDKAKQDLILSV